MDHLLSPQIKDSCKLALPDGLKELMSDISREVLRYQPRDIYSFIADYLSAMLITRDNLSIAGCLCDDITRCGCDPELQQELRDIGLAEDDIKTARDIIVNYLEKGPVKEISLVMKLLKETGLDEDQIPAVLDAVRKAFLRHQAYNTTKYESSSDSEHDGMMCAAMHTLGLYRKTAPTEKTYEIMAEKIQNSYRAYGVRRDIEPKDTTSMTEHKKSKEKAVVVDPKAIPPKACCFDDVFPKTIRSEETVSTGLTEDPDLQLSSSMLQKRLPTVSSTSLAGSLMMLSSHKPYSVHDCDKLSDLEELPEREHAHMDYTAEDPRISLVREEREEGKSKDDSFEQEVRKLGLEVIDDTESKDSNQIESIREVNSEVVCVMRIESPYDGDTEMDLSEHGGDA